MKTPILITCVLALISGCATTQNGQYRNSAVQSSENSEIQALSRFEYNFERLLAYSQVIGHSITEDRVMGIVRYPLIVQEQYVNGSRVKYSAKCPVGYEIDNRGVVIKPYFFTDERIHGISDCKNILDDFSVYLKTGKTIAERLRIQQEEFLNEAKKHQGTPEYGYWILKAADIGSSEGQYLTGLEYIKGKSLPQSNQKGIEYLTTAAKNGHAVSQYLVGKFYFDMNRSSEDLVVAYAMFKAASQQHQTKALEHFNSLRTKLNLMDDGKEIIKKGETLFNKIKGKY